MTHSGQAFQQLGSTADAFALNDRPEGRRTTKYRNYFEIYDRYSAHLVGRSATIVEIGVQHGGSLAMWRGYFGPAARIIGVDIREDCRRFGEERTEIFVGDQSDPTFLDSLSRQIGEVDLIIDDGSHIPSHQKATFEKLFFSNLKEGGYYIVEDCHTSYWPRYGGGYKARGSFIEYAKNIVDELNEWHADNRRVKHTAATDWIASATFYCSVVVFEKRATSTPPPLLEVGDQTLDLDAPFREGTFARVILTLKRSAFVQAAVRRNPLLWRILRRMMAR